jgi:CubicO group peptidase (beta-lactamase class C family)
LDPEAVDHAYSLIFDPNRLPNVRSALVARHGRLVAEGYVVDARDIDRQSALMSATKCVTSTLAGIALDRGEISSLDVTLGEVVEEAKSHPEKRGITLEETLTMRCGVDYSNDDFSLDMDWGGYESSLRHILSKPMYAKPGESFYYTDACVHLAGAIVSGATERSLADYARRHLFSPLGIGDFEWLAHSDGLNYGAYGLFLTPRDLLRFTQGILRSHRGEGGVISQEYIQRASSHQVEPDFGQGYDMGYYWWIAPHGEGFTAWGHGGQFAFVVPEFDIAIAVTADPNSGAPAETDGLDVLEFVQRVTDGIRG